MFLIWLCKFQIVFDLQERYVDIILAKKAKHLSQSLLFILIKNEYYFSVKSIHFLVFLL